MTAQPPPPPAFAAKKAAILASLSAPESTYTDLSPKGTVDEAIRSLIDHINALEGVVTTSSCAGRMSVFLEGKSHLGKWITIKKDGDICGNGEPRYERQAAVPGGKGMGGRWLFVSHEPVPHPQSPASRLFGLEPRMKGKPVYDVESKSPSQLRLARFQFEPMILHIMTASLHHAQPILAAAINAGFRESGVQSLKNLDDANSFPMVAIRSTGLALESVVGVCHDREHKEDDGGEKTGWNGILDKEGSLDEEVNLDGDELVCSIVSEPYCDMLRNLGNERFKTNRERMRRLEDALFHRNEEHGLDWEDSETRKQRKRAEGLRKQKSLRKEGAAQSGSLDKRGKQEDEGLFASLPVP